MAGAMRRMGIYLGLVEDDDARGYARYDARQPEQPDLDRRYGRYPAGDERYADDDYDEHYDGEFASDKYGSDDFATEGYAAGSYAAEPQAERRSAVREADPLPARRPAAARSLGLASPAGAPSSTRGAVLAGSAGSAGSLGSAGLAVREPVSAAPEPTPAPTPAPQPYRITTLHPRTYNEARTIGERFRDGMPVIMNLTEMDDADAKRLVDFAAGLSFGLRGSIERVTAKVFLLSPQNVDVTAEDKARIREGGFFNQS
ncbi:cell division protein SepF [Geodermatophilus sp. YIM 151500]|uniref:cell division protein SepF n=1 Tax=Geodermatophilus sp. YIM 151500 TaxID=2984531 RepID=UPI002961EB18|nr:cell division protein SepF [Geodermatophilus sp. YIM 151500]